MFNRYLRSKTLFNGAGVILSRQNGGHILDTIPRLQRKRNVQINESRVMNCYFSTNRKNFQIVKNKEHTRNSVHLEQFNKANMTGVRVSSGRDVVSVDFGRTGSLDFPAIWLRDNCRCGQCFDTSAQSRIINLETFDDFQKATKAEVSGGHLIVTWEDGHESSFSKLWLCDHSFMPELQIEKHSKLHVEQVTWSAKDFSNILESSTFAFQDIMTSDKVLLDWLEALARFGVAHINSTPSTPEQVLRITERVAFVRRTHYGSEFLVKGSPDANNVAYKTGALQLHTDLPYYDYSPGVILLHCIVQSSSGGENILCDGFNAVKKLSPQQYKALSDTVIDWVDLGQQDDKEFHSINPSPVLCKDNYGKLVRINWSQPQRGSTFNVSINEAIEWYGGMKRLCSILHHPDNAIKLTSQPGDIVCIDNRRVLHGRLHYEDSRRLLSGAYMDWDEMYSKIRVLRKSLLK